jgi:ABC-type lipoprotein export system ATPase subunit
VSNDTAMIVLTALGLTKSFVSGDRRIEVLRGVDLAVAAGESVSIRGESGSGKSTMLNLLAGLDAPDNGSLLWENEPASAERRGRFLGIVFQRERFTGSRWSGGAGHASAVSAFWW